MRFLPEIDKDHAPAAERVAERIILVAAELTAARGLKRGEAGVGRAFARSVGGCSPVNGEQAVGGEIDYRALGSRIGKCRLLENELRIIGRRRGLAPRKGEKPGGKDGQHFQKVES
jgi:hypothetical protein